MLDLADRDRCRCPAAEVAGRRAAVPPAPAQGPLTLQNQALPEASRVKDGRADSAAGAHLLTETQQTFGGSIT
jgi:gamma-glutamyltranspeptidase/glutathione hydrolase